MECIFCKNQCQKGFVEASGYDNFLAHAFSMYWYPESEEGKFIKKHQVPVYSANTAYYCPSCKKAFAIFENSENGIV